MLKPRVSSRRRGGVPGRRTRTAQSIEPAIQRGNGRREYDAPDPDRRSGELVPHQRQRRGLAGEHHDRRQQHADEALADDHAGRHQDSQLPGPVRIGGSRGTPVVEPADDGAHHDHEGRAGGQVDTHADRQRRQMNGGELAQRLIEQNHARADHGAVTDQSPVEVSLDHAARQRGNQGCLRRGQGTRGIHARRARKTIGVIQQIQDRWDDRRPGGDPDDERHLLPPRRRVHELPGLQVLQVVVGDGGRAEHHRGDEQREGDQCRPRVGGHERFHHEHEQQGRADHDQDSDAGQGTVGGPDETGHVAAYAGDEKAHQGDVGDSADHQDDGVVAETAGQPEIGEQPRQGHHARQGRERHDSYGNVLFDARQRSGTRGLAQARSGHGRTQADGQRLDELHERPDGRNADGACADEAHLMAPDGLTHVGGRAGRRVQDGQQGDRASPGDERADQHRDAHPQSHQMPDGEQRKGQGEVVTGDGVAAADAKIPDHVARKQLRGDDQREQRRHHAADHDRLQSIAGALGRRGRNFSAAMAADLEHFGTGNALRIRQIRIGDERAAQRDGVHHAEHPSQGADGAGVHVGEAAPPTDHDQAGQHENNRRERARGGCHGLHDVVFLNGGVPEAAQHRHRDHRRRNRRGEGESGLEAEKDVGGREDQRDQHADDQSAQG